MHVVDSRTKAQTDRNDHTNNMGEGALLKNVGEGWKYVEM